MRTTSSLKVSFFLRFAVLSFVLMSAVEIAHGTQRNPALQGVEAYDPLQHSHLIVRGTVVSISSESIVPGDLLNKEASDGRPPNMAEVQTIEIVVVEVLKGIGPPIPARFLVFPRVDIKEGQEVIVCAKLFSGRKLSRFVSNPFLGLYKRVRDGRWVRLVDDYSIVPSESLTNDELLSRVRKATLPSLTAESDVIARGSIVRTWESVYSTSDGRQGTLVHYQLKVIDQMKGASEDGLIEFVVAKLSLSFVPKWYRDTPRGITVGQEWFVFLRLGERGLYPFGGPNSLMKVDGGQLIYDMAVTFPMSVHDATSDVREMTTHGQD